MVIITGVTLLEVCFYILIAIIGTSGCCVAKGSVEECPP